jgi:hypothetical protein
MPSTLPNMSGHSESPPRSARTGSVSGNRPTRFVGVSATLLIAMWTWGCGTSTPTLDAARVQSAVASSILTERGLRSTVTCPSNVPREANHVFTCTARLDVGRYPVTVVETDGTGHVRYESRRPLVALNVAKVEHAIATSILRERHLVATVTCPAEVLQRSGIAFTCTAVISGRSRRYPFSVTEVDEQGHVQYVGR